MGFVLSFAVYDFEIVLWRIVYQNLDGAGLELRQNVGYVRLVERREREALLAEVVVECCQCGSVASFNVANCHFSLRSFSWP